MAPSLTFIDQMTFERTTFTSRVEALQYSARQLLIAVDSLVMSLLECLEVQMMLGT